MRQSTVLVVDDEKEIADFIELYLKNENYNVHKFYNGKDALACVEHENIDLAILDVMLPDIDGFEILKQIRLTHNFPVIMLLESVEVVQPMFICLLRQWRMQQLHRDCQESRHIHSLHRHY